MLQLTTQELHNTIVSSATLVVSLALSTDFTPLAGRFPDVVFAKVEPAEEGQVATLFGISNGPALMIFRDGIGLYLRSGDHDSDKVTRLLRQACGVDMADVKAALERERSEAAVNIQRMCPAVRRGPLL
jgi:hypothetical protein